MTVDPNRDLKPVTEHAGATISFNLKTKKFRASGIGDEFERGRFEDVITELTKRLRAFELPVMQLPDTAGRSWSSNLPHLSLSKIVTARSRDGVTLTLYDARGYTVEQPVYVFDQEFSDELEGIRAAYDDARRALPEQFLARYREAIQAKRSSLVELTADLFEQNRREHLARHQ